MSAAAPIPVFELFGETERFPDVVHCERISDRASKLDWTISAHRHHQLAQLLYLETGVCEAKLDNCNYSLSAGNYVFLPAQVVHSFTFTADTEGVVLSFPMNVVNSIGPVSKGALQNLARPVMTKASDRLSTLIALLALSYKDTGTFRAQVSVGLAHAILAIVAESGHTSASMPEASHRRRIQRLDSLIADHMAEGWGPREYASALSVSTGHLSRICREAWGISTATYIENAAMTEACRLLAFTRLSVAEIGYRLGFTDPSYFSRRYRAVQGLTPSKYRGQWLDC